MPQTIPYRRWFCQDLRERFVLWWTPSLPNLEIVKAYRLQRESCSDSVGFRVKCNSSHCLNQDQRCKFKENACEVPPHLLQPGTKDLIHRKTRRSIECLWTHCCTPARPHPAYLQLTRVQVDPVPEATSEGLHPSAHLSYQFVCRVVLQQTHFAASVVCVTSTGTLKEAKAWTKRPRYRSTKPKTAMTDHRGENHQDPRRTKHLKLRKSIGEQIANRPLGYSTSSEGTCRPASRSWPHL